MDNRILLFAAACAFCATSAPGQSTFVSFGIEAKCNIYAAGQSVPFDGGQPLDVRLPGGSVRAVAFTNLKGVISSGKRSGGPGGAAGSPKTLSAGTMIESFNGLSSLVFPNRFNFLAGVFLGPEGSPEQAPSGLTFSETDSFEELRPQIGQVFFIGDGTVGVNNKTLRRFLIPPGASRLFLGVTASCRTDTLGPPGCYSDNTGDLFGRIAFLTERDGHWESAGIEMTNPSIALPDSNVWANSFVPSRQ